MQILFQKWYKRPSPTFLFSATPQPTRKEALLFGTVFNGIYDGLNEKPFWRDSHESIFSNFPKTAANFSIFTLEAFSLFFENKKISFGI